MNPLKHDRIPFARLENLPVGESIFIEAKSERTADAVLTMLDDFKYSSPTTMHYQFRVIPAGFGIALARRIR